MTIAFRNSNILKTIALSIVLLLMLNMMPGAGTTLTASAAPAQVAGIGEEVLIFLGGAIVGGVVYDGVKWGFVWATGALTPLGQAAVLTTLAVAGIAAVAVYMKSKDQVNYVVNSVGCTMTVGGTWQCPTRAISIS